MHAVILTFPGHFFQTALTVRSLRQWYPEIKQWSMVLDDVQRDPWWDYEHHTKQYLGMLFPDLQFDFYRNSDREPLTRCVAGWWRQQLVKLTLDEIQADDEWFVVDGDVVFCSRCEVRDRLPVTQHADIDSGFTKMATNYVTRLLGVDLGYIQWDGRRVGTNPVPFRHLDRALLRSLRQHVESRFDRSFVELHLEWFLDQTIVAHIEPPDRMVMTEWELIEAYRRYVLGQELDLVDVGSGYDMGCLDNPHPGDHVYAHAYRRDTEIDLEWWQTHLDMPLQYWDRAVEWYQVQERARFE